MTVTGDRLRLRMRELEIQQDQLADDVGCSQGAISQILSGATRNSRFLPKIAERLGVRLPWLMGTSDEMAADSGELTLTAEQAEWLRYYDALTPADREALLHVARSMNGIASPSRRVHATRRAYRGEEVTS